MVKIGDIELHVRMALAPMAGVTDLAFRAVCREHGAALTCTEMVSAKALVYGDAKTKSLLALGEGEYPAGAQIFGSEPDIMGEAAALALELSGAAFIDINMGCPVGKIARSGDGSALMRDPDKAALIIEAVRRSVSVPVTVKFRKGWDSGNVNAVEFARMAEQAGAAAVAVHGRTKAQMYSGKADWSIIREVKRAVTIPVFANGDIFEPEDAKRILDYTGADIAQVGRGSFGNPWLFERGGAAIENSGIPPLPPLAARIETAARQCELAARQKGEKIACLEGRRHLAWYLRGVSHSGYFKSRIVAMTNLAEMREIVEGIKRELR